jgi:DDE superfamily endonuclease
VDREVWPGLRHGLRRRRAQPGDKWHLDEVFIQINDKTHYLWRAVDQDGNVLDILVTSRRDTRAATRLFRKLSEGPGVRAPGAGHRHLGLGSYQAARRSVLASVEHPPMTTHPDHSRAETQADFWHPTGHCCIEAKSVLAMHQAGRQEGAVALAEGGHGRRRPVCCSDGEGEFGKGCWDPVVRVEVDG